jgi:hypothetical protein
MECEKLLTCNMHDRDSIYAACVPHWLGRARNLHPGTGYTPSHTAYDRVDLTCMHSVTRNPRCVRSSRSCASLASAGLRMTRWRMRHWLGRVRNLHPGSGCSPSHAASGRTQLGKIHAASGRVNSARHLHRLGDTRLGGACDTDLVVRESLAKCSKFCRANQIWPLNLEGDYIYFLWLHSLWDFFSKARIALFMGRRVSVF